MKKINKFQRVARKFISIFDPFFYDVPVKFDGAMVTWEVKESPWYFRYLRNEDQIRKSIEFLSENRIKVAVYKKDRIAMEGQIKILSYGVMIANDYGYIIIRNSEIKEVNDLVIKVK